MYISPFKLTIAIKKQFNYSMKAPRCQGFSSEVREKFLLFFLWLLPIAGKSQVTIQMQEDGGVYKIPCEVNGLRMKFIFDTGASNVCLSLTEAKFMYENEYITDDDILGSSKAQIADGSIVENTRILLKEIKIAGLVLRNVEAVVTHSFGAPLLLGQSAIQKLGRIQISGNELTIIEHENDKSDAEIDKLFEEAGRFFKNKSYSVAARKYQELYDLGTLSDYGIYLLANSYYFTDQDECAIQYLLKIKDFKDIDRASYHQVLGHCYSSLRDYDNALYHYELESEPLILSLFYQNIHFQTEHLEHSLTTYAHLHSTNKLFRLVEQMRKDYRNSL